MWWVRARLHPGGQWLMGGAGGGAARVFKSPLPWGHANCGLANRCGKVKLADCDDKNDCTLDGCDPDKGCVQAAISGCP